MSMPNQTFTLYAILVLALMVALGCIVDIIHRQDITALEVKVERLEQRFVSPTLGLTQGDLN
jgi:hypothetical protein